MLAIPPFRAPVLSRPFSPLQIPGLVLWLRADTGLWQSSARTTSAVADGDPVGLWEDLSGAGNNVTQGTSTKKPTLKLAIQNGQNVVRFDGVDDFLKATFTLNQPHTRLAVLRDLSAANATVVAIDGATVSTAYFVTVSSRWRLYAGAYLIDPTDTPDNAFHVLRGTFNGASSVIALDGGAKATGDTGAANPGGIFLGGAADNTVEMNVDMAEVLEYSSALSDTDVTALLSYLKGRYATP